MIHPDTELRFINEDIGYGVVATKLIPKGTITWVIDKLDREFTPEEYEALEPLYQDILGKYCFRDSQGQYILCWDIARYVNHSFNSNCLATAYNMELAIRDIQPGEELTDDYGYLNLTTPFRALDEGKRRKTVYPDDLAKYHKIWDRKLASAFKYFSKVSQPLSGLVPADTLEVCNGISAGTHEMMSILNCMYTGDNGNGTPTI